MLALREDACEHGAGDYGALGGGLCLARRRIDDLVMVGVTWGGATCGLVKLNEVSCANPFLPVMLGVKPSYPLCLSGLCRLRCAWSDADPRIVGFLCRM